MTGIPSKLHTTMALAVSAALLLPGTAMAAPDAPDEAPVAVAAPVPVAPPEPAPASDTEAPVVVVTPTAPPPPAPPAPTVIYNHQPLDHRSAALRHERNLGIGMTISGFTIFGTSYLISALIGTISLDLAADTGGSGIYGRRMLIPVAGPFMAIPRADSATGGLFTGLVGVAQIGGLLLGTAGAIKLGRAKRKLNLSASSGGLQLEF